MTATPTDQACSSPTAPAADVAPAKTYAPLSPRNSVSEHPDEAPAARHERGLILWFTGLSGSGKSTLSQALAPRLRARGRRVEVLDGDEVREHLSRGLGFSREDRDTNIRRIGYVARLLARHGVVAITAAISPYRATREELRGRQDGNFIEIYVECPLETLAARDPKGLYQKALAGEIEHFTGVSDPYEPPLAAELHLRSDGEPVEASVERILAYLEREGWLAATKETAA